MVSVFVVERLALVTGLVFVLAFAPGNALWIHFANVSHQNVVPLADRTRVFRHIHFLAIVHGVFSENAASVLAQVETRLTLCTQERGLDEIGGVDVLFAVLDFLEVKALVFRVEERNGHSLVEAVFATETQQVVMVYIKHHFAAIEALGDFEAEVLDLSLNEHISRSACETLHCIGVVGSETVFD